MENSSIKDLQSKGLVRVPYPTELRNSVETAVASWKAFCGLPEELRAKFPYGDISGSGSGVGYELKKTPGANLDLKEDFHFTIGSREWLEKTAQTLENPAAMNFIKEAGKLVGLMEPLVMDFAANVEKEFALKDFRDEVAEGKPTWIVRFLHYFGDRKEGDEIATPHADKSGFTLHLYESDPGLQYLDFEKQWQEMPVSSGETAIIPGMRLQYRSHNRLKATCHRVIATEKTATQGRFSVVCFINLVKTPGYDKSRAGRLQEFQPGFNYEMPFEEFAKLFI